MSNTPQFEQLLPEEDHQAYDPNEEEKTVERRINQESFIDLNDDNVIYQSKKTYSPIQLNMSKKTTGPAANS